jgi:Flp pilus assembly protein TadB
MLPGSGGRSLLGRSAQAVNARTSGFSLGPLTGRGYHRVVAQLVGDQERERAALELRRHYSDGRLTTDELAQRLETALRARSGAQLRSALTDLPAAGFQSPVRMIRNAAIVAGTAVIWLFWSVGMLVAFVAWLAADGPSLAGLLVFPLLWLGLSWVLWSGSRRRRAR